MTRRSGRRAGRRRCPRGRERPGVGIAGLGDTVWIADEEVRTARVRLDQPCGFGRIADLDEIEIGCRGAGEDETARGGAIVERDDRAINPGNEASDPDKLTAAGRQIAQVDARFA